MKEIDHSLGETDTILTNTSVEGVVNRVDQALLKATGFSNNELIGNPHSNIVHEDMPASLYDEAVGHARRFYPWLGLIKQRRKDGEVFWTDTVMTPVLEDGRLDSIRWVGAPASKECIERAEQVYKQLGKGRRPSVLRPAMALRQKLFLLLLLGMSPLWGALLLSASLPVLALASFLSLGVIGVGGGLLLNPLQRAVAEARALYQDPLASWIYSGRRDEAGQIKLTMKFLQGRTTTLLGRIDDASVQLARVSEELDNSVTLSRTCVQHQEQEAANVSAAIHEMSTTVQNMASNANNAALMAQNGVDQAMQGSGVIENTISRIQQLASDVGNINERLQQLAKESEDIGSILDVIRDIAEQTNLLALNAAIEAARAGEQGRGFAVVADEVRTLATRTHDSTREIQKILEKFQGEVHSAADLMATGVRHANETTETAAEADEALGGIASNIASMNDINAQIASATEEEGAVIEEINKNMTNLKDVSDLAAESMDETSRVALALIETAGKLERLVQNFRQDL